MSRPCLRSILVTAKPISVRGTPCMTANRSPSSSFRSGGSWAFTARPTCTASDPIHKAFTHSAQRRLVAMNGDLNNTSAMREMQHLDVDPACSYRSLALSEEEDDSLVRKMYRPFLLSPEITASDWVSRLELSTVVKMAEEEFLRTGQRLKVLVLYGSLRQRSYSRLLAFEASRILFRLGCDVRVFDPAGLPVKDDVQHHHPKVQELRDLSRWSDGHVWISAEQHGNLTAVFKNQIDWIPLSVGSVRPTQGRTLAIAQVSGGSQSFNAVNSLRILGRWMRMFVIPNQSSVPKAYTQFTDAHPEDPIEGSSRMMDSPNRERIVDCMEEFVKYTLLMKPHFALFGDRYSERDERAEKERKAAEERKNRELEKGVQGLELADIVEISKT